MPNYFPVEFLRNIKLLESEFKSLCEGLAKSKVPEPLSESKSPESPISQVPSEDDVSSEVKAASSENDEFVEVKPLDTKACLEKKDADAVQKMYTILNTFLYGDSQQKGILELHNKSGFNIFVAKTFGSALKKLLDAINDFPEIPIYGEKSLKAITHLKNFLIYLNLHANAKDSFGDSKIKPDDNIIKIAIKNLPTAKTLKKIPPDLDDKQKILEKLDTSLFSIAVSVIQESKGYQEACQTLDGLLQPIVNEMQACWVSQKKVKDELSKTKNALIQPDPKDSKTLLATFAQLKCQIDELEKKKKKLRDAIFNKDIIKELEKTKDYVSNELKAQQIQAQGVLPEPKHYLQYLKDMDKLPIIMDDLQELQAHILNEIINKSPELQAQWLEIETPVADEKVALKDEEESKMPTVDLKHSQPLAREIKPSIQSTPTISFFAKNIGHLLSLVEDKWVSDINADSKIDSDEIVDASDDFKFEGNLGLLNILLLKLEKIIAQEKNISDVELPVINLLVYSKEYESVLGEDYEKILNLVKSKNNNAKENLLECLKIIKEIIRKPEFSAQILSKSEGYSARIQTIQNAKKDCINQIQSIEETYHDQIANINALLENSNSFKTVYKEDKEHFLHRLEVNLSECLMRYKKLKENYLACYPGSLETLRQIERNLQKQLSRGEKRNDVSHIISNLMLSEELQSIDETEKSTRPDFESTIIDLNKKIYTEHQKIIALRQEIIAEAKEQVAFLEYGNRELTALEKCVTNMLFDEEALQGFQNELKDCEILYRFDPNFQMRVGKLKEAIEIYRQLPNPDFDVSKLARILNKPVTPDFLLKMLKTIGSIPEDRMNLYPKKQRAINVVEALIQKMNITQLLEFLKELHDKKDNPEYSYLRKKRSLARLFSEYGNTRTWNKIVTAVQGRILYLNTPELSHEDNNGHVEKPVEKIPEEMKANYDTVMRINAADTWCKKLTHFLFAKPPVRNFAWKNNTLASQEFENRRKPNRS